MSLVIVSGDAVTTTVAVLAATWPSGVDAIVVEADVRGGSLAAWLDVPSTPSLTTAVTTVAEGGWPAVERALHTTDGGIRVLVAPTRSLEAANAVGEAETVLLPLLAALDRLVVLVDAGSPVPATAARDFASVPGIRHADLAVVVHRQTTASARAAAVRVERLAEQVEAVTAAGLDAALVVIGDQPFDPSEIARFVAPDQVSPVVFALPDDPLAAAVVAGRAGVSMRRFARLPLLRAARRTSAALDRMVTADRRAGAEEVR